jgi:hypothetical protein
MKRFSFPPSYVNFIVLVPLIAKTMGSGEEPMTAADLRNAFVGNTVVAQLPEGTAYDFVKPSGAHLGLHPEHGRLDGTWHIDAEGKACVTWNYPSGGITNCGQVVDLGGGKYKWGDQTLTLQRGDAKQLSK